MATDTGKLVFDVKFLLLVLVVWISLSGPVVFAEVNSNQIKILVTSDIHGWLSTSLVYPTLKRKGLLHISDFIRKEKKKTPGVILLDAGDLLQGSPLQHYYNHVGHVFDGRNIFLSTVNSLGYDAVVVGNHDVGLNPSFELNYLRQTNFTWLSANLY